MDGVQVGRRRADHEGRRRGMRGRSRSAQASGDRTHLPRVLIGSGPTPRFRDRDEAGRSLGTRLLPFRASSPVVLGIPRGGLPVAAEVARALDAPLDVLVVRKLGVPWHPELGFGAIGEGGASVIDAEVISMAGLGPSDTERVIRQETAELERRIRSLPRGSGSRSGEGSHRDPRRRRDRDRRNRARGDRRGPEPGGRSDRGGCPGGSAAHGRDAPTRRGRGGGAPVGGAVHRRGAVLRRVPPSLR